ncbi:MAG: BNR-4 repeat-containing protein [Phycisphaerae bacterium]|nr:BNR-4 repeat-containing protein [Phycisphaerae bacterium]
MRRRDFLKDVAAGAAGVSMLGGGGSALLAREAAQAQPFLLSDHGCGRATGYAETNKIVTVGDKTHVTWLDSVDDGFRVRIRTLDRKTSQWSPIVTIGKAFDNHGGPALTVDAKGYLHIVYYPHHHPFRYRRSTHPNDASAWDNEIQFGKKCTYPTLVCGPDDTLYLTCRESGDKTKPWVVSLYVKRPGKDWQGPRTIMRSDKTGYSHFQEALAWGPDHRTLHLSTRMYSGDHAHTVGYMASPDYGKTWQTPDGKPIELPATRATVSAIAHDRDKKLPGLRCGSIAVDPKGTPHVLYSAGGLRPAEAWIASLGKDAQWRYRPLLPHIQQRLPNWCAFMPGGLTIGADGRWCIALTGNPIEPDKGQGWGGTKNEILWLESSDAGESFTTRIVSKIDPNVGHWMPSIERPTGHNRVARPGLMYLAGDRGKKNTDILSNGVFWVG